MLFRQRLEGKKPHDRPDEPPRKRRPMGLSKKPGMTSVSAVPDARSRSRRPSPKAFSPAFDAAYTGTYGSGRSPACEVTTERK